MWLLETQFFRIFSGWFLELKRYRTYNELSKNENKCIWGCKASKLCLIVYYSEKDSMTVNIYKNYQKYAQRLFVGRPPRPLPFHCISGGRTEDSCSFWRTRLWTRATFIHHQSLDGQFGGSGQILKQKHKIAHYNQTNRWPTRWTTHILNYFVCRRTIT